MGIGPHEPPLVLGIDVGTQSIRAIVFDRHGSRVADERQPTPVHDLGGGAAEYDPEELFETVLTCLHGCARTLNGAPVAGLAVASVGESCVLVDGGGHALARAPVWYDRRPDGAAKTLCERIAPERLFEITGLGPKPILTLAKLLWMQEAAPDAIRRAKNMCFIADWIAYRLSGVVAADFTLASRTLLLDIHGRRWSREMMEHAGFDLPLPPLKACGAPLGPVRQDILARIRMEHAPTVCVGGHDHLIGAFAAGINQPGQLLDSLGTAEALLLAAPAPSNDPAVMHQGFSQWAVETDKPFSFFGGGILSHGGAVEWLRHVCGGPPIEEVLADAAKVPPGSDGVVFLPHLFHAPPPAPDPDARGAFVGLAQHISAAAMMRAVLEGLAMQAARMLDALSALPGVGPPREIRLIGGGSRSALGVAIKAAVFGREVKVMDEADATALGAAMLGGIGAGVWPNLDAAVAEAGPNFRVVEPEPAAVERYKDLRKNVFDPLQAALATTNHEIAASLRQDDRR
ncbi:MAG: FGGY-family carbohydrate kinase [Pseudomonadota bacterium]